MAQKPIRPPFNNRRSRKRNYAVCPVRAERSDYPVSENLQDQEGYERDCVYGALRGCEECDAGNPAKVGNGDHRVVLFAHFIGAPAQEFACVELGIEFLQAALGQYCQSSHLREA
jgi:hypothetical protein